jgi:hypothetical protein
MEKMKKWLNDNAKEIIFGALMAVIVVGGLYIKQIRDIYIHNVVSTKSHTVLVKNKEHITPRCTKTEVDYILKNTDNLLSGKDFLVLDLNSMMYQKDRLTTSKETGKKIYGVWRKLQGHKRIYLVIYEDVDDLEHNKKDYARYLARHKVDTNTTK